MSPRTGRPTDDPKIHQRKIRFSDVEVGKIDYCCKVLGLSKSDVIRRGIDKMYTEAQETEKSRNARVPD